MQERRTQNAEPEVFPSSVLHSAFCILHSAFAPPYLSPVLAVPVSPGLGIRLAGTYRAAMLMLTLAGPTCGGWACSRNSVRTFRAAIRLTAIRCMDAGRLSFLATAS